MTKVEQFLRDKGIDSPVIYPSVSSATVDLAAKALGVAPERIAKSMALRLKTGVIVLLACGTARIDNKLFKAAFGEKPRMLSQEETLQETGHPVGGVCPFALPGGVAVYLDQSLAAFESVYPAAGTPASAVEMTPEQLERVCGAKWVQVCTVKETQQP